MQEREQVLFDVHGVAEAIDEQVDFVNTCLSQLDTELNKSATVGSSVCPKAQFSASGFAGQPV